jgi:hypothetical protein
VKTLSLEPDWPAFNPETASAEHFHWTIAVGPIPNQKYYAFWDKVKLGWKG